jgi:hypothetical protein
LENIDTKPKRAYDVTYNAFWLRPTDQKIIGRIVMKTLINATTFCVFSGLCASFILCAAEHKLEYDAGASLKIVTKDRWRLGQDESVRFGMPTIRLEGVGKEREVFLISAVPLAADTTDDQALALSYDQASSALMRSSPQSVTAMVELQKINDGSIRGFYFTEVDKAPSPTGYKNLTQGSVVMQGVFVTFSMFSDHALAQHEREALRAVKYFRLVPADNSTPNNNR